MAFSHGSKAYFEFDGHDISTYLTSAGVAESVDTAETSTLGRLSKLYIPGLSDGTVPLEGNFEPVVFGWLRAGKQVEKAWVYGPQGNGAGLVKISGNALITALETTTGIGDKAGITASLQITGDIAYGTF
jgi:hypothetical protein